MISSRTNLDFVSIALIGSLFRNVFFILIFSANLVSIALIGSLFRNVEYYYSWIPAECFNRLNWLLIPQLR